MAAPTYWCCAPAGKRLRGEGGKAGAVGVAEVDCLGHWVLLQASGLHCGMAAPTCWCCAPPGKLFRAGWGEARWDWEGVLWAEALGIGLLQASGLHCVAAAHKCWRLYPQVNVSAPGGRGALGLGGGAVGGGTGHWITTGQWEAHWETTARKRWCCAPGGKRLCVGGRWDGC